VAAVVEGTVAEEGDNDAAAGVDDGTTAGPEAAVWREAVGAVVCEADLAAGVRLEVVDVAALNVDAPSARHGWV
jgi:hypothetical protein